MEQEIDHFIEVLKLVVNFFKKPINWVWFVFGVSSAVCGYIEYFNAEYTGKWAKIGLLICFSVFLLSLSYQILLGVVQRKKQRDEFLKELSNLNTYLDQTKISSCTPTREKEERCHQIIINKLDERSHFQYYTSDVTDVLKQKLANKSGISKLKIICYGRNGYGEVISYITRLGLNIDVEVIMYNTENEATFQRKDDRTDIDKQIKDLKSRNNNVKIYVSDIPPMIRASALYVGDTAIWTTIQAYQFKYVEYKEKLNGKKVTTKKLDIYRPDKSLIIICDETSSKKDFDGVTDYFNEEFRRLKEDSKEAVIDNDEVKYQVRDNEK